MSRAHTHRRRVRFTDCDPAGIVYFPRYFDWFHQAMESWFDEDLGLAYSELITERRLGLPCVHTEADFKAGCRLGEDVEVELSVEELGNSSITLAFAVRGSGELKATGRSVVVLAHMQPEGGVRLSRLQGELRERVEAFVADSGTS